MQYLEESTFDGCVLPECVHVDIGLSCGYLGVVGGGGETGCPAIPHGGTAGWRNGGGGDGRKVLVAGGGLSPSGSMEFHRPSQKVRKLGSLSPSGSQSHICRRRFRGPPLARRKK